MEYAQELSSLKCHVETGNDEISNCVVPSDKYLPMLTIVISGIEYVRTARKIVLDDIYYHLSRLDYIFHSPNWQTHFSPSNLKNKIIQHKC